MQAARMRRAISKRWKRGLRARPLRRKSCSIDITMRGAARSIRSSAKKRIELRFTKELFDSRRAPDQIEGRWKSRGVQSARTLSQHQFGLRAKGAHRAS